MKRYGASDTCPFSAQVYQIEEDDEDSLEPKQETAENVLRWFIPLDPSADIALAFQAVQRDWRSLQYANAECRAGT